MDNSNFNSKLACAQESLDLLNCVTHSPFDESKCLALLHALRHCVQAKKVKRFTIDEQHQGQEKDSSTAKK